MEKCGEVEGKLEDGKLAKRVWRFLADRMGNGWKEHELGNVSMSPPGSSVKFKVARNQMLGCSQGLRGVVVPTR
jgi:hypothetical protein